MAVGLVGRAMMVQMAGEARAEAAFLAAQAAPDMGAALKRSRQEVADVRAEVARAMAALEQSGTIYRIARFRRCNSLKYHILLCVGSRAMNV
jgi:ABC-type amino acid transport substrate-binding protein